MKELRKIVRQTLKEYITPRDLRSVEDYADELFSDVGVDVEFTKHFLDRANDLRNKTDITTDELKHLYTKAYQRYANQISKLPSGSEAVLTDPESNINVPFVMNWDGKSPDIDLVNKTVMRKKDFKSYTPKLQLEDIDAKEAHRDIDSIQTLIDKKRNVAFITLPTEQIIDMINDNGLLSKRVPLNKYMAFIIYRPEGYNDAMELFSIAEKYGGYLSGNATEKDSRRIGQLLGYKESDIDAYIEHNKNLLKKVAEDINVPINIGDEVLGGKFKNKKVTIKDIGKNEKGDITINDKPLLRFRIKKK